jgi:LSD1 subclass zinc finger protein
VAIKKYLSHEKINVYRTLVTDQGSIKTLIFPRYFNADFLLNKNFRQHRFRSRRKLLSGCLSRDRPRKQYNPKYREGGGRPPLQLDSGNTPARCVSCSLFNLCMPIPATVSVSVVDPDWIRIQWAPWIRIQEGKNDPRK